MIESASGQAAVGRHQKCFFFKVIEADIVTLNGVSHPAQGRRSEVPRFSDANFKWPFLMAALVLLLAAAVRLSAADPSSVLPMSGQPGPDIDYVESLAPHRPEALSRRRLEADPAAGQRTVVDVMMLYTGLAKAEYGMPTLRAKAALALAYLNEACNRSGVNTRFRLVCLEETGWHTETPRAMDELNWLRTDRQVAALREQVGADLVSLFVRGGLPNGGIGEMSGCFTVFNGSSLTFAHEIGHNLGCEHDRAHSTVPDSLDCNFGYSFIPPGSSDLYGDIMSYVGSQIEQFSSPDKFFLGAPTGLPPGHVDAGSRPDGADSASVLRQTSPYVAFQRSPRVTALGSPALSQDGARFQFRASGPATGALTVEFTSDYVSWTLLTNGFLAGDLEVGDNVEGCRGRFYRARVDKDYLPTQVGFVKKTVPPGFSMIANPLETPNNSVGSVLAEVPEGTQLFKWLEGKLMWEANTFGFGSWDDPDVTLHPGEGAIIKNTSGVPFELQFAGEVNQAFHNRVPLHESVRSSAFPQAGLISSVLGCAPFGPGTTVFRMKDGQGGYTAYSWDGVEWSPTEPSLEMGEAFWCRNSINAFIWQRVLWNWP